MSWRLSSALAWRGVGTGMPSFSLTLGELRGGGGGGGGGGGLFTPTRVLSTSAGGDLPGPSYSFSFSVPAGLDPSSSYAIRVAASQMDDAAAASIEAGPPQGMSATFTAGAVEGAAIR